MELDRLIESLSDAAAYPYPVEVVEVHQTHISAVFLASPFAYKIKKPVNLGFLDFSTLEKRRHFCEEEVRLNRRLAPDVYLGVVPITSEAKGTRVEGDGPAIEWAVKMHRLPDDATLEQRLQRAEVSVDLVQALARKVVAFHAKAHGDAPAIGHFDMVAGNARENFDQVIPQVGTTISRAVFERLKTLTHEALGRLRPLISSRAQRGVPRDTHGDLHLDHVYLFPDRAPPADLVIIDCVEFNERFRFADPVADMAFLVMDFLFHGRQDLARAFADEYFRAAGDEEGRALLPFYVAYRAAVRGKVEGFELLESEIPAAERASALQRARGHWLLALGQLEQPFARPCLVLVAGLPGTGKSTLARDLANQGGFHVIRTDVVRKQLAGLPPDEPAPAAFREGLYSAAFTGRTYAECLRQADALLFEGNRVIVDASFAEERKRRMFLGAAARLAVPAILLVCQAEPETIRARLSQRRGDASDADWLIYRKAAERWENTSPATQQRVHTISCDGSQEESSAQALSILRESSLAL